MPHLSFLADEHVKRSYVRALRANGFEVVAVSESNDTGQADARHVETSSEQDLVVLTNDDDFVRLAEERSHGGIVFYSNQGSDPGEIVRGIRRIDQHFSPTEIRNHIEWLENWL